MTLYMEITKDKYELPVAVADTPSELARLRGVALSTISHALSRPNQKRHRKYVKIEVEEDEQA